MEKVIKEILVSMAVLIGLGVILMFLQFLPPFVEYHIVTTLGSICFIFGVVLFFMGKHLRDYHKDEWLKKIKGDQKVKSRKPKVFLEDE